MKAPAGVIILALSAWLPCRAAVAGEVEAAAAMSHAEPVLSLPDEAGVGRALKLQAVKGPSSLAQALSDYASKVQDVRQTLLDSGRLSEKMAVQRDVAVHLIDRRIDALGQAHKAAQVLEPVFEAYAKIKRGGDQSTTALRELPGLAADAGAAWKARSASETPRLVIELLAERLEQAAASIWPTSPSRLAARRALAELVQTLRQSSNDRAQYAWNMRYELGLERSPEEISLLGQAEIARIKARMTSLAKELYPDLTLTEAMARLQEDHPASDQAVVDAYSSAIERAVAFNRERGLFDAPRNYQVDVEADQVKTGELAVGAASYSPPFEKVNVTLSHDDPRWLAAHNNARIPAIAVHEGFPGHHYQDLSSGLGLSQIFGISRLNFLGGGPTVEGYAFYVEKLLAERGFFSKKEQLGQLGLELFRAYRLVIDPGLTGGRMTPQEATRMLVEEAFLAPAEAETEVARYVKRPGQALSYFAGYWQIAAMKEAAQAALGPAFNEADFHSAFLSFGPIPLPVIAERVVDKMRSIAASRQPAS